MENLTSELDDIEEILKDNPKSKTIEEFIDIVASENEMESHEVAEFLKNFAAYSKFLIGNSPQAESGLSSEVTNKILSEFPLLNLFVDDPRNEGEKIHTFMDSCVRLGRLLQKNEENKNDASAKVDDAAMSTSAPNQQAQTVFEEASSSMINVPDDALPNRTSCILLHRKASEDNSAMNFDLSDVQDLYAKGLEVHQSGCYRESFTLIRPTLPYLSTCPSAWIRLSEACIFELYEESFEFNDIYARIFSNREKKAIPSIRRQMNESRRRHVDMSLRFAEIATSIAYHMSRRSERAHLNYAATQNYIYILLKVKKYKEAFKIIKYSSLVLSARSLAKEQLAVLLLYATECHYHFKNYEKAIEYALYILRDEAHPRFQSRAMMTITMSYMKLGNYREAMKMVNYGIRLLDHQMLENLALLGVTLAHKMGNVKMLETFLSLLQEVVY